MSIVPHQQPSIEMRTKHLHRHPLKLTDKGEKDGICNCIVCREKLSGQIYACEPCNFFLHESCLLLPQQIQHFFHPCPLFLKVSSTFVCNACYGHVSDFKYRCSQCDFDIDIVCAQLPFITSNGENEQILHFCHRHPLQLSIEIDSKFFCQICEMLCSGPTWGCQQCLFHVHKSCLEILPQKIQSKLDPFPFILLTTPSYHCIGCRQWFKSLGFRSIKSHRHLCVNCALVCMKLPSSSKLIQHFFHPCPLFLIFSPFSTCYACFQNHSNFSYHCHKCDFFLDLECAQLTYEHELSEHRGHFCHWHPLELLRRIRVQCKLCEKFDSGFLFGCSQCNFYIHPSCIEILPHMTTHLPLNRTLLLLTIPSFICTTCERASSGLTFNYREGKLKFCAKCILWPENEFGDCGKVRSIHHWHQLTLHETSKIYEVRCFLCGEYCSTSTYDCRECNACFHKSCAELPRELRHPIDLQHSLTLTNKSLLDPDGNIFCKLCLKNLSQKFSYNGIYHCKECNIYLDTLCASCQPSIKYQGHRHLLSLVEKMHGDANCQVCRTSCKDSASFRCAECNFNLHLLCGPLPCTIKHISHVHPLTLEDYYVEDNETDEFACHVCEERRDPRFPVYRCAEGCLMICDVKCVSSEVISSLRGEYGDVELRTVYPNIASKVIGKELVLREMNQVSEDGSAREENEKNQSTLYLDIILETFSDSESEKFLTLFTTLEEEVDSRAIIDIESEGEEETYYYSKKAFTRFINKVDFEIFKGGNEEHLFSIHSGCTMVGEYALSQTLIPIFEEFFHKYEIIGANCNLGTKLKGFFVLILCSVLYNMHTIKVVDVTKDRICDWLMLLKLVKQGGFQIDFIIEHVKLVAQAHFVIQAKKLVDSRSSELNQRLKWLSEEIEKLSKNLVDVKKEKEDHDAYEISGSRNLKKEYKEALLIKWKYAIDGLWASVVE